MQEVVVIGNGESREKLYLPQLKNKIITIGCNALHREFPPDHLICCDKRMVVEAQKNPTSISTKIYTRSQWSGQFDNVENIPELPYSSNDKKDKIWHWSSGPIAVLLATTLEAKTIHMVGFDLWSTFGKVNNIYKGTSNYSNAESSAVDPSYWEYHLGKIFELFPKIDFIIYNNDYWNPPDSWKAYSNVSFKTLINFKEHLHLV